MSTHEFSPRVHAARKGNVIFARELLIGGIAARTPDGAAASNRRRGLARIGEARPAIGRGVSVCSDDPFRQTATCRCSPLIETLPAIPGFAPNRLRHEGEKEKEAGACSLPITGSLLIIVIGLPRNRQPIHTRSQRSEPRYYWRTVSEWLIAVEYASREGIVTFFSCRRGRRGRRGRR